MKVRELGRFIRDQRGASRLSLRRLSKLAGISNPYLSQIERGLRRPSAEILQAIAKALRISAETLYVKAGILEERPAIDITGSIRSDSTLNAKQKQILLDLYQSFHAEGVKAKKSAKPKVRKVAAAKKPAARKTKKTTSRPASRAASTRKAPARRRTRRSA